MEALVKEINAACRKLGVPPSWGVKQCDENAIAMIADGETWGWRFVELKHGRYIFRDREGKERRWKLHTTAVDRASKRVAEIYEAREEEKRRRGRVSFVQDLLCQVDGLSQSTQKNLFYVGGSDARFWVYHAHIHLESRNFGLHASIEHGAEDLDVVILFRVRKMVASIQKVIASIKEAEAEIEKITGLGGGEDD